MRESLIVPKYVTIVILKKRKKKKEKKKRVKRRLEGISQGKKRIQENKKGQSKSQGNTLMAHKKRSLRKRRAQCIIESREERNERAIINTNDRKKNIMPETPKMKFFSTQNQRNKKESKKLQLKAMFENQGEI